MVIKLAVDDRFDNQLIKDNMRNDIHIFVQFIHDAAEKIERLRNMHTSQDQDRSGPRLRAGTEDELKVNYGMARSNIVSRSMSLLSIKKAKN